MRRWVVYTAGFLFVGCISIGGVVYWKYEPSHHWNGMEVPVLSVPALSRDDTLTDHEPSTSSVTEPVPEATTPSTPEVSTKSISAFNVLVLGTDARKEEYARSDVIMVLHVMPELRKVNIVSIPRDSRVLIDGVGYTKINHAHMLGELKGGNTEGTRTALQTVSNFLDVPINYYLKTDFKGFEDFIDTIGGVDVEVASDVYLYHAQTTLAKGPQHIDGKLALSLVRERYAFPDGDFGRQYQQSQILKNVAQEILRPEHISEIAGLLTRVKKDIVDTNFQDSDLISLAWLLKGMSTNDFTTKQIPGHSGYEMDPLEHLRLYYWIPDKVKVMEISQSLLKDPF
ncbi:LCP family protein [Paenibacillus roseipurpureus]|uniref:LCP family protein n=1 Tax=Paenibacillus roseopurpureus TaxID=2918901 RepID=A0AA96RJG9_9BACL|nr:LCP family protein [Paenibacillus sp. MBLB1832]WNR43775.1 LCP family protein [Paenibacillus sp. MBLB1832]